MLYITRGLPGSGKTTWAKGVRNAVRVNRDDLRDMLHGGWTGGILAEEEVSQVQFAGARALLRSGSTVIIDDTNLSTRVVGKWAAIAHEHGVAMDVYDFTGVPLDVCVARDSARSRMVGADVIRGMYERYFPVVTKPEWRARILKMGMGAE